MGGVGIAEFAITIIIFSIIGFFIWKAVLKYLVAKGSMGINIAASIMSIFQSPVLAAILLGIITLIATTWKQNEIINDIEGVTMEQLEEKMKHEDDSIASRRMIRIAKLTIDADQLEEYKIALSEQISAALTEEDGGVVNLYAVFEKNNPTSLTILEIYADTASYAAHLKTPHFLKYKNGTKDMVKSLELIEVTPLPGVEFY